MSFCGCVGPRDKRGSCWSRCWYMFESMTMTVVGVASDTWLLSCDGSRLGFCDGGRKKKCRGRCVRRYI